MVARWMERNGQSGADTVGMASVSLYVILSPVDKKPYRVGKGAVYQFSRASVTKYHKLKTTGVYSLTTLEARILKSRHQQHWFLLRHCGRICSLPLS